MNEEEEIKNVFAVLTNTYKPATEKTANASMKTTEFYEKMTVHYPGALFIGTDDVYAMLKDAGYTYKMVGEGIEWLVRK